MAVRPIDGDVLIEWFSPYLHAGEAIPADVVIEDIRSMPTLTPPNEPLTRAGRHQYTRQELEQLTAETAVYIEGAGIAQLQWGGWEIAEGVRDGYLFCKHIKPFAMDLYDKYWTAWDGPPHGKDGDANHA